MKADTPKPTEGLEYTYIRKAASNVSDRKELAHLWELSGSTELSQEILSIRSTLAPDQVHCTHTTLICPLLQMLRYSSASTTHLQVATAVIAVVVDLSQPAEALKSAVTWLQLAKSKLQNTFTWLERQGSQLPEQLRLRARKYLGSSHEDKDTIQHLGKQKQSAMFHRLNAFCNHRVRKSCT